VNLPRTVASVHVARLATDESLINLYVTGQRLAERTALHSEPDSVKHEPRRLLRDAQRPMNLIRATPIRLHISPSNAAGSATANTPSRNSIPLV
jgi:hypothetical protein